MSARLPLYLIAGAATLAVIIAAAHFWNQWTAWLPWSVESRLERVERDLARTTSDLSARTLEVEAAQQQAAQTEARHTREVIVREITVQAVTQARGAPDAETPLDPDRLERLRSHDDGLCNVRPGVCAPSPDQDASGS